MTAPNLARPRRWGNDGRRDPVAHYVAPLLGITPASAMHLLKGRQAINLRCAHYITAFRQLSDDVRLARFWEPMIKAYDQREAPPLVAATWQLAQAADAREEISELAYLMDQSDTNLDRCIRDKEAEVVREMALLDALRAEQRRRGCA